ncbi:MAG: hypothetical protein A3E25_24230 [Burkholderiales bacterium RIFCSPHIGHO2_12_FULL_69_20]|nr:MAG: hypothetical protein A3E25_24230 [Burkholderiales bacterium RIFCSPHIGHO2_12_FULL_69_20]
MKRQHDPLRLDVAAFTGDGAQLAGRWPGASLPRLAESQNPPQDVALAEVDWAVQGERRAVTGGEAELWLALQVQAPVWLTCQRCLQPYALPLVLDRRLRFVRGEAQAEALDAETEDDVLALSRSMDLRELVEDELLLALPIVPRHSVCPQPLPMAVEADPLPEGEAERPNPFAALQWLKRVKPDGER